MELNCGHCRGEIKIAPGATGPNGCGFCKGLLCTGCTTKQAKGAPCPPWQEKLLKIGARRDALRSYGL